MNHLSDLDNDDLLDRYAIQASQALVDGATDEDTADLKTIKREILSRITDAEETHCRMGARCPKHDNQVHGQEAHELRTALEALLEEVEGTKFTREDPWQADEVCHKIQIDILDAVDCRDSFAYEQKNDRQARLEQADKVRVSVEGLDLLLALRVLTDNNHPARQQLQDKGLIFMRNVDGVCLTLLGAQTLEKLDTEDEEPKSRFQSAAFLATDVETEGV